MICTGRAGATVANMTTTVTAPTVLDPTQQASRGKAARKLMPRDRQGDWVPGERKEQPVDLILEQATTRVPELIPIRHGRMAASPFSYYRGAALPMAADLAVGPNSGLRVQLCGDAHLSNFGGFASPEREMLFDANDFDETAPGPFEWDLKRLVASFEVAARELGMPARSASDAALRTARSYQHAIRELATKSNLEVWYAHLGATEIAARWGSGVEKSRIRKLQRTVERARNKDQIKARAKLTRSTPDGLRFVSDPPLVVPFDELAGGNVAALRDLLHNTIRDYRRSLQGDRRRLLENYRFVDLARKVVGVGSVGTRAWIGLFVGSSDEDTLILQIKEAEASVLERYTGKSPYDNHGQRVVEGQRLTQSASDIFLGWQRVKEGVDGRQHDYYVRQLWDWKLSADVSTMDAVGLGLYAELCGWTLACGHARSGDRVAIASYVGTSDVFPRAMARFAASYADQNQVDYDGFLTAIRDGRLQAELGV